MRPEQFVYNQADTLFGGGLARAEQRRLQPYRQELRNYYASHHERLTPFASPHPESHSLVEMVDKNAADFLYSSDISAGFVSAPEFQQITQKQKKELREDCAIGLFICIDGRLVRILIGSNVFDISETLAGLVPVNRSPLDNELELANPRIIESISDRPLKESPEILQFSTGHKDSSKPDEVTCKAVEQMIDLGLLPNDGTHQQYFRQMLLDTGVAVGATFNRSARAKGREPLANVGLTAMYDTRTAGFTIDGESGGLNTTTLTKQILTSEVLSLKYKLGQPGLFRSNFTDPATLLAREYRMFEIEKLLMRQSKIFGVSVEGFIDENMGGYTEKQKQAFRFFVARTIASQITTGLYQGGDSPVSMHNEQYISSSTNGMRVGQSDPHIQSFGANVADYTDSVAHLETKVKLADSIGKMKKPYVAFVSESEQEKSSPSTERDSRAKLRAHMKAVTKSPFLLDKIKSGQLWLTPTVLYEKTGIVKSIPNLAI